ncbi:MAG TPA: hypothetical protein RMH99_30560 [Sandaracinaceae bacterium LLY-WYZ-13_1]|nr:hypothetical protein [Sandaracinaceae bacterium LLY-WYZ-13_1]
MTRGVRPWWLAALLLAGCARNAVLELEIDLPRPAGRITHAVVQARSGAGFDGDWSQVPAVAVPLDASCVRPEPAPACRDRELDARCSAVVSVVAGEAELAPPLSVRVRFCADASCTAPAAPAEHRVAIERAFYRGRYTQARTCIDALPTDPAPPAEPIARCEVRCRDGTAASYCRLDGTHFCEE